MVQKACAWAIDRLKRCCEKMGEGSLHCSFPVSSSNEEEQVAASTSGTELGADAQEEEQATRACAAGQPQAQPDGEAEAEADAAEADRHPAATPAAGSDQLQVQCPDAASPYAAEQQVNAGPLPE
jgi:hypothetical protein